MNISGNMRFQSTEGKIEKAVMTLLKKRKYDSFSVKDICAEAGVNRSTFYAHYLDINDLMIKIEDNISQEMQGVLSPLYSLTSGNLSENPFIAFFRFILENKAFYKAFIKSNTPSFLAPKMMKKSAFLLQQVAAKEKFNYSETEINYHLHFFGGGLKAVCVQWLLNDCSESPEEMAKIIHDEYTNNARIIKLT